jgi:hypothetical protein
MPPASALVVPRADNTVSGLGCSEASVADHLVLSRSIVAASFALSALGARREMVWTTLKASAPRMVDRMKPPTRPVLPITVAVAMLRYWLGNGSMRLLMVELDCGGVSSNFRGGKGRISRSEYGVRHVLLRNRGPIFYIPT